ncbi:MAG: sigma-70 factor domain-containing protein, partial [Sulfurovaceae bacterium]|nr:sigma-70 factor domain-containing protein [Sulfurovaceae bacterium]
MAEKDSLKAIEDILNQKNNNDFITYENIAKEFSKPITNTQAKKIYKITKDKNINVISASEAAKNLTIRRQIANSEVIRKKNSDGNLEEEFDFAKEKELLEWSRSDSPVRMYLREMGKIPLLTKDEEVDLSIQIKEGEDIIIDAICSVPYLVDYIIRYKEPLLNRERRVKELFKSFEDVEDADEEVDENENTEESSDENTEESSEEKVKPAKDDKRVGQVLESFKALEKAKKEWMKSRGELIKFIDDNGDIDTEDVFTERLKVAYKKELLKHSLLDLGPTSKLINELVKAMETALKSDDSFEKELKRLEYKLPLFNEILIKNHEKILKNIINMSKEDIAIAVPEAT